MAEKIIGIDLGTTNSEVAVVENGRVTVIDITPGHPILPSFVGLADDGSILVGEPAKKPVCAVPGTHHQIDQAADGQRRSG
jgi:molecular chaperone DnaK